MRLSWVIYAALGAAAVAGGVYYVTKVDVKVELPPPSAPAPSFGTSRPDTFGKMETARNPKFPHQAGSPAPGSPPRSAADAAASVPSPRNSSFPDAPQKAGEQGSGAGDGGSK